MYMQFNDNVLGPASNFDQAYWEIRYIRTFLADDAPPIPPQWATTSSSSSSATSLPTAGSGGTPTNDSGVARPPVASRHSGAMSVYDGIVVKVVLFEMLLGVGAMMFAR